MELNKTRAHYEEVALAAEMLACIEDGLDLVPRMSDDDPIAPALVDWCGKARAVLAKVK